MPGDEIFNAIASRDGDAAEHLKGWWAAWCAQKEPPLEEAAETTNDDR